MDYIFGTLSTEQLRLYRHLLLRRGVQHRYEVAPRYPQDDEAMTLTVQTGVDFAASVISVQVLNDGTVVEFEQVGTEWDTLAWGYTTRWQATLVGYPAGTLLRYQIKAIGVDGAVVYADYPDVKASSEAAGERHFAHNLPPEMEKSYGNPAQATTFTLPIGQPPAPVWAHEAIIYHVFIDRFYPGDGREWQQPDDLMGFYGGTLRGVLDKLDYIANLGANTIWLSPLFPSPSHHGYDATDFRLVEPRLGSESDLRDLIEAIHERGMRILLDLACNHLSNEHPFFQDALSNPNSRYREWFTFDESDLGYKAFFGVAELPEINLANPDTRDWMIENALYWLREFDIDGYRLDYANGPDPDFWAYFNRACKVVKPDCFCFGEVIDAPDMVGAYVGRLDGLLDFQLNGALRNTFGWESWDSADYHRFLHAHIAHFPDNFIMPAFIDNHDMNRFITIANGDETALLNALEALLALPNPPVIYYGTEIGLTQPDDGSHGLHLSRVPMRWDDPQDDPLREKVKALIHQRRSNRIPYTDYCAEGSP